MEIKALNVGDRLKMKKKHPCGGDVFVLQRTGSLCRAVCELCGRAVEFDRIKLEKAVQAVLSEVKNDVM